MTKQDDQLGKVIAAHKIAEEARKRRGTRLYERSFKAVVRSAIEQGVSLTNVHRVTGISTSTLHSWLGDREPLLRKISVQHPKQVEGCAVVQLPSGIRIELPAHAVLVELGSWLRASA